jgi:hypothetical protein
MIGRVRESLSMFVCRNDVREMMGIYAIEKGPIYPLQPRERAQSCLQNATFV